MAEPGIFLGDFGSELAQCIGRPYLEGGFGWKPEEQGVVAGHQGVVVRLHEEDGVLPSNHVAAPQALLVVAVPRALHRSEKHSYFPVLAVFEIDEVFQRAVPVDVSELVAYFKGVAAVLFLLFDFGVEANNPLIKMNFTAQYQVNVLAHLPLVLEYGAGPEARGPAKVLHLLKLSQDCLAPAHRNVGEIGQSRPQHLGHVLHVSLILPHWIVHKFFVDCVWNLDKGAGGNVLRLHGGGAEVAEGLGR